MQILRWGPIKVNVNCMLGHAKDSVITQTIMFVNRTIHIHKCRRCGELFTTEES